MFFYFSKVFIYLLNPLLWILGILLYGILFQKKPRNKAITISFLMLLLLTNPYLVNRFAQVWDIKTGDLEKNKVYSCAIILGGFSSGDDSGNGYFNGSADRFIQGLKLKNNRTVTNLLVVGGNSQIIPGLFNESIWVKQQLMEFNIPENNILIETRSRNTLENALFAKEKLRNKNLNPPYLLITSAFHMRRSMYSFQKQGLEVIPYTSNYIAGKSSLSIDEFIPQASVMGQWGTYLKEVIGFGIYYVNG